MDIAQFHPKINKILHIFDDGVKLLSEKTRMLQPSLCVHERPS